MMKQTSWVAHVLMVFVALEQCSSFLVYALVHVELRNGQKRDQLLAVGYP